MGDDILKCMVTGGAGFIGSHLVQRLLDRGDTVVLYDNFTLAANLRNLREIGDHPELRVVVGDVLDYPRLEKAMRGVYFVYHLAALTSHKGCLPHAHEYIQAVVMGTVNVLQIACDVKAQVVFTSSSTVYGKQEPPFHEGMPMKPEGPYARSKAAAEGFCEMYSKYHGLNAVSLRLFNVVGPRSKEIHVIHTFTDKLLKGERPTVNGHFTDDGFLPAARDFTDVRDTVEGILQASQNVEGYDVFNLGAGGAPSRISTLLELVMEETGIHIEPLYAEVQPHESLATMADISKARRVLGYEPKHHLEESVKTFVEWYRRARG